MFKKTFHRGAGTDSSGGCSFPKLFQVSGLVSLPDFNLAGRGISPARGVEKDASVLSEPQFSSWGCTQQFQNIDIYGNSTDVSGETSNHSPVQPPAI